MLAERTTDDELVDVLRAHPDLRQQILAAVNGPARAPLQEQLVAIAKDRRLRAAFRRSEYRVGTHFITRVGTSALCIAALAVMLRVILAESETATSITSGVLVGAGAAIALVVGLHILNLLRPSPLLVSITLPTAAARAEELDQEHHAPNE